MQWYNHGKIQWKASLLNSKISKMVVKMITQLLNDIESRYERHPTVRLAVGLALRGWVTYAVADVSEPREYLHRANHTVVSKLRKNESDLRLFWLTIFFAIELEHFDKANELLDNAYSYRSFYKNNQPFNYAVLHFLYAYLEVKQKRAKSARKHLRTIEGMKEQRPEYALMRGMVHLVFFEYNEAYECLSLSYEQGCRSVFLFASLFSYYRSAIKIRGRHKLLLQTLHWALNHGANVEDIVYVYQDELHDSFEGQLSVGEQIYQQFPNPGVLKEICLCYMAAGDYSSKAHAYYRDAERRQVLLPNLPHFLVKSAYENGAERIHHYTLTHYLRNTDDDVELKTYVYHLLLTDRSLYSLVPEHINDLIQLALHCLRNNVNSRYANSLYLFFWLNCKEKRVSGTNVGKAERFLQKDLFKFEVTDPSGKARYLYVNENERRNTVEYIFPEDGSPLIVEAVGSGFRYVCLGENRKEIIDTKLDIERRVSAASPGLYQHFYEKGARGFEILAYLARSYILAQKKGEEWDWDVSPVLEEIIASPIASQNFVMQINVALGQWYYKQNQLDKALAYYKNTDENALDDIFLEHMLTAYIQQKEWEASAGLIERKNSRISDRILFTAVKSLATPTQREWHPQIAVAAYGLLQRSRYDKDLLAVTLDCFKGTQAQWLALDRALSTVSVHEPQLDKMILQNGVWGHHFDEGTQRIFARMSRIDSGKYVQDYMYYAIHEIIIGEKAPLPETIAALERAFWDEGDSLLAYGLCYVYLRNEISTNYSDKVMERAIQAMEAEGWYLPIFKMSKTLTNPYMEKYQPFLYRSLPGKEVWLYYKAEDDDEWRSLPMHYWRFGLYLARLPHFYNERLLYYFSEEMPTGSITTREQEVHNTDLYLDSKKSDPFFIINNAIIYERMFKYDQVEEVITGLVKDVRRVRSELI